MGKIGVGKVKRRGADFETEILLLFYLENELGQKGGGAVIKWDGGGGGGGTFNEKFINWGRGGGGRY